MSEPNKDQSCGAFSAAAVARAFYPNVDAKPVPSAPPAQFSATSNCETSVFKPESKDNITCQSTVGTAFPNSSWISHFRPSMNLPMNSMPVPSAPPAKFMAASARESSVVVTEFGIWDTKTAKFVSTCKESKRDSKTNKDELIRSFKYPEIGMVCPDETPKSGNVVLYTDGECYIFKPNGGSCYLYKSMEAYAKRIGAYKKPGKQSVMLVKPKQRGIMPSHFGIKTYIREE
jgi:hypothetical protein